MKSASLMAMAQHGWAGPRERAVAIGVESLGDAELVALVLSTGYAGVPVGVLAEMLIEEHGGLAGLARAGMGELVDRPGVGMAKGARLTAAVELGRRVAFGASLDAAIQLPDREAVEAWARPRLATLDHEELWALMLDGRHGLRSARRVASGGIHGLHVAPRDALRIAVREAASAIVLVHNHPSGDPNASDEDIAFTSAVAEAARVVGTPLLDHVIIARRRASSMLEAGLLR